MNWLDRNTRHGLRNRIILGVLAFPFLMLAAVVIGGGSAGLQFYLDFKKAVKNNRRRQISP